MGFIIFVIIILLLYFIFVLLPNARSDLIRKYKNIIDLCDYYDQWFQTKEKKEWAFKGAKEIIAPLIGQEQLAHILQISDFDTSKIMKAFRKEANQQLKLLKLD